MRVRTDKKHTTDLPLVCSFLSFAPVALRPAGFCTLNLRSRYSVTNAIRHSRTYLQRDEVQGFKSLMTLSPAFDSSFRSKMMLSPLRIRETIELIEEAIGW